MTEYMIVAPGEPVDRLWVDDRRGASTVIHWMPSTQWTLTTDPPDPSEPMPLPRAAMLRILHHPSWGVFLWFWTLGPTIPDGYVMPGWVQGGAPVPYEDWEALCRVCRRRADWRRLGACGEHLEEVRVLDHGEFVDAFYGYHRMGRI